jgi:uroporphyrinogen decarboxylase
MFVDRMTPRERVLAAINFHRPDRVPVTNFICDNPLYRLGPTGLSLLREFPGDFGDPPERLPCRDRRYVQPDGSWRRVWTDEWGCTRREEFYGIEGVIVDRPLASWAVYDEYELPPPPSHDLADPQVCRDRAETLHRRRRYYVRKCFFRTFERLHFLRGFENVMTDLAAGEPRLADLADRITERNIGEIRWAAATGADAVVQSDDWGTQQGLMISPRLWREFFKPRYRRSFEAAAELGLDVWFHTDGHTLPILADLAEIGVKVVNPQFSCHDVGELAAAMRANRLAVMTDLDRQRLIPFGTPAELHDHVREVLDVFAGRDGGLVGHAAIRGPVPLENIRAIFEAWREFGVSDASE